MDRRTALITLGLGTPGLIMLTDKVGVLEHMGNPILQVPDKDAYEAIFFHYGRIRIPSKVIHTSRGAEREKFIQALDREYTAMKASWLRKIDTQNQANGYYPIDLPERPDVRFEHDIWSITEAGKFPLLGKA